MAMNTRFMILIVVLVFGQEKNKLKAKDANMKKCQLPKQCFKDYDNLVCRGFKTLSEIDLKWENCSEYKEEISKIFFYPSEKIIFDFSLN